MEHVERVFNLAGTGNIGPLLCDNMPLGPGVAGCDIA